MKTGERHKTPDGFDGTLKQMWLRHFLDASNPTTFLKQREAVFAAGYNLDPLDKKDMRHAAQIGCQNFATMRGEIQKWLDEIGLSKEALGIKLMELLFSKETKIFTHQGRIVDVVDVEALAIQRATLDMALRVRGMYAAEEKNINIGGKGRVAAALAALEAADEDIDI